jgi:CheY-like chemotaxis protein
MAIEQRIIYVEDSPHDAFLLKHFLHRAGITDQVDVFAGEDCVRYLRELAQDGKKLPRMVIIDLWLSGADGNAIVQEVRCMPQYSSTRVVVFSGALTSSSEAKLLANGATACIEKPNAAEGWKPIVQRFVSLLS